MIRATILATIILGVAGLSAVLAHRASAAVRHAIWVVALAMSVGVAVIAAFDPVIEVESTLVPPPAMVVPSAIEAITVVSEASVMSAVAEPGSVEVPPVPSRGPDPLLVLWLIGAAAVLGRAVLGHVAVARLIARSTPFTPAAPLPADVRISADVEVPFTLGTRRPVIVLPAEAVTWTEERLRIVLVHELAHVARLDYFAQLVATLACAIYWFNPITWLAASRLRAEAEHAADDRVLAAGVDGVTYASHLLELARPDDGHASTAVAVGMARGTNRLERRFSAMFDSTRSRKTVPLRLQAAAGSAALLVAVPLTALRVVPVVPELAGAAPATGVVAPVVETPAMAAPRVATARVASPGPVVSTVIAAAAQAVSPSPADTIIDRTVAASPGERLSIDLPLGGGITVRSWNQSQVRVRAVLSGDQSRDIRFSLDRVSGGLRMRTWLDYQPTRTNNSNRFEIWVPQKFDIEVSSSGGAIDIAGVEGRFTGNTGGGSINLEDVAGEARLSTGGGSVLVSNSSLNGTVTTGGGQAIVTGTTGDVRVSSGSGPVVRTDGQNRVYGVGGLSATTAGQAGTTNIGGYAIQGSANMTWAGGDIRLESVPNGGRFTTGGGGVEIGSVGGPATFTTGGGDVRIGNIADDITVTTGAGSVELTLVSGNGTARTVHVTSGTGRVVIDVPANLDVRFDLETAYTDRNGRTRIESDIPLTINETEEWDSRNGTPRRYVRGSGSMGAGRGVIRVRTVNGDVVIRRR